MYSRVVRNPKIQIDLFVKVLVDIMHVIEPGPFVDVRSFNQLFKEPLPDPLDPMMF